MLSRDGGQVQINQQQPLHRAQHSAVSQTGGSGDLREAGRIQRFKRGSDPLYQTLNQVSWEDASKFYKKKEYQFGKQIRTIFCVYLTIWHERSPHWMEASLVPNFVES